jgi:hypothetical protein
MSRYVTPASKQASKIGITNRGSTALRTWLIRCSRMRATIAERSDASTVAPENRTSPSTWTSPAVTRAGS